jgi:hypothetical protein
VQALDDIPGAHDFDFELVTWDIVNKRRKKASLYENPETNKDAEWEEFPAIVGPGAKMLDGRVAVAPWEGTFPSGEKRLGMTVRAFDPSARLWSFAWLDNFNPPDFTPLVGKFENGVGLFEHEITTTDGRLLRERFIWTVISDDQRKWQQEFSLDDGVTWDANWVMEFTKRKTVQTHID